MNIEDEIFNKSKINVNKLLEYGFIYKNNNYVYENILDNNFNIIIKVNNKSKVKGIIIDKNTNEEYYNYRLELNNGVFANTIRNKYKDLLIDIRNKCFDNNLYIYNQTNRVVKYIYDKYNVSIEHLWNDFNYGIFRNKINNKWFAIIMDVDKSKLISNESGIIEIINVKLDDKVNDYLNKNGIYKSYHMSKKNWVSVILNDTLSDVELFNLIDISYNLINKKIN